MSNLFSVKANLQFMSRSGWHAKDTTKNNMLPFHGPVDYVIVSQTAMNGNCVDHEDCCHMMRMTQNGNMYQNGQQSKCFVVKYRLL